MRLAEMAGEPDWIALGKCIPDETFEGWVRHFEAEPFGSNHLYDFLANAFLKLCHAIHVPDFAGQLRFRDFKFWDQGPEPPPVTMSDDDILANMKRWEALKKDGSV